MGISFVHGLHLTMDNVYNSFVIESFKSEEAQKIFEQIGSRKLPPEIQATAYRRLEYLNRASNLSDLASVPGNRLERLTGNRVGQYSIRINDQWRVCFNWNNANNAVDVEIVDYH